MLNSDFALFIPLTPMLFRVYIRLIVDSDKKSIKHCRATQAQRSVWKNNEMMLALCDFNQKTVFSLAIKNVLEKSILSKDVKKLNISTSFIFLFEMVATNAVLF
jgi:hypothetical protein